MALAKKRQHVVLAQAVEVDVLDDDHLVRNAVKEGVVQHLLRIQIVTAGEKGHGLGDAGGRAEQSLPLGIFPDQFDLSGGHIRQAILSAAHEAAQSNGMVTQHLLIQGVAREYAKLGRTLRREDFGAAFAQVRGG